MSDISVIRWKYCIYDIYVLLRGIFFGERIRKRRKELDLSDRVDAIIDSDKKDPELCERIIRWHRMVENTNARRRLERWATRLITSYLIIVALLVIADSLPCIVFNISDNVLITILSTTTINILGLVIIVLRGHFPNTGDKENKR